MTCLPTRDNAFQLSVVTMRQMIGGVSFSVGRGSKPSDGFTVLTVGRG